MCTMYSKAKIYELLVKSWLKCGIYVLNLLPNTVYTISISSFDYNSIWETMCKDEWIETFSLISRLNIKYLLIKLWMNVFPPLLCMHTF